MVSLCTTHRHYVSIYSIINDQGHQNLHASTQQRTNSPFSTLMFCSGFQWTKCCPFTLIRVVLISQSSNSYTLSLPETTQRHNTPGSTPHPEIMLCQLPTSLVQSH